jgi:serine/threonine protein kinase
MHELSTELGRFIGGGMSLDQLRAVFRTYLAQHQDQRELISRWLRNTVEEGRLSANVWLSLRDLFEAAPSGSLTSLAASLESPAAAAPPQPARPQQTRTQLASPGMIDAATALAPKELRTDHRSEQRSQQRLERRADRQVERRSQPAYDTLRIGVVVKERFVLVEQLGSGGMGQVYKARDLRREEAQDRQPFIALKVLNKEVSAHPDSFMALQREARRAGTLAHPNVVTVYDFDRDGPRIYMTMEYLEGRGLDAFLQDECKDGVPMSRAWPIIHGIAMALEYGHSKRIVHSDLKPGNIFICDDGTVKVLDFGIARLIRPTDTKSEETLFDPAVKLHGLTPAYASLEMWSFDTPDPRDDIYALACVTYELLSGRHPFERRSAKIAVERNLVPKRIESLSRAQWDSLKKGLALHREQRTRTIGEFIKPFAPRSRWRKYAVPGATVAVLATAAAVAVSARFYRESVEFSTMEVLQCAQIPRPAAAASGQPTAPPTAEQQREIEDDLILARDYLTEATPTLRVEDLKSILSDGTNSVNDILDIVLKIEPTNAEALQLKARVAEIYASRARLLLDQKRVPEALDLVRYSRKVLPASQELFRLEQKVCRAGAAARRAAATTRLRTARAGRPRSSCW